MSDVSTNQSVVLDFHRPPITLYGTRVPRPCSIYGIEGGAHILYQQGYFNNDLQVIFTFDNMGETRLSTITVRMTCVTSHYPIWLQIA